MSWNTARGESWQLPVTPPWSEPRYTPRRYARLVVPPSPPPSPLFVRCGPVFAVCVLCVLCVCVCRQLSVLMSFLGDDLRPAHKLKGMGLQRTREVRALGPGVGNAMQCAPPPGVCTPCAATLHAQPPLRAP